MTGADITDLNRRLANVVTVGQIEAVDYATATARVRLGDNLTANLPLPAGRAGGNRTWSPPEVGEQVIVLSPSGNLASGCILSSLYSETAAAPGNRAGLHRTVYANGAVIEYDRDENAFTMDLAGGSVSITAPGGLTIIGTVTVTGDVIADGISLTTHTHPESIGTVTGVPQ